MHAFLTFLNSFGPFHWLGFAFLLLVAELITGTTYILWPAIAAALTGLVLFFLPLAWPLQWLLFAGAGLALTAAGHRFVRHYFFRRTEAPALNDRAAQLLGQSAVATTAFSGGSGRVKLGDSEWAGELAEPASQMPVAAGDRLIVADVDGGRLILRPVERN